MSISRNLSILAEGATSAGALTVSNLTSPVVNSATTLQLQTNGTTTAVTIDASQNVTLNNVIPSGSTVPTNGMFLPTTNTIGFSTASTERMRIDSTGHALINSTALKSGEYLNITYNGASGVPVQSGIGFNDTYAGGGATTACTFYKGGTAVGSITVNGSATAYNTSSDYRLKINAIPIKNALTTIEALNPVSFTWIDGRVDDGFLAHELQSIIPNCVTGDKDAINKDGTPKYQQMDSSGVIPFLVASIKELKTIIDLQQTQITALNAKVGI